MIKKLRNQTYAPKSGASSQMRAKRKKKNPNTCLDGLRKTKKNMIQDSGGYPG
jgi:hypothetical protein